VCSNATSLPEVAGDAALLVDPESPEALAQAINRVLTDDELRCSLIERGRRQVMRFSWPKFTLEIVRILREVRQARRG
jgi:glycosyltransferase involved in cell wall biosynthesis